MSRLALLIFLSGSTIWNWIKLCMNTNIGYAVILIFYNFKLKSQIKVAYVRIWTLRLQYIHRKCQYFIDFQLSYKRSNNEIRYLYFFRMSPVTSTSTRWRSTWRRRTVSPAPRGTWWPSKRDTACKYVILELSFIRIFNFFFLKEEKNRNKILLFSSTFTLQYVT